MELILISSSKLKIMLTRNDVAKYELNLEDIDNDKAQTGKAFRCILDEVKRKTGFDASRDKILVQIFPSRCGGCEIFITKPESMCTDGESTHKKPRDVYRFSKLDDLISVCRVLFVKGYKGESAAYYDDKNYYLTLDREKELMFIREYADMRENKNYIYHILEHCERICAKEAVNTLAAL